MSSIVRKPQNKRKPYVVRYWEKGTQRERGFATMAEARGFRTEADMKLRYGKPVDDRIGDGLFGVAAERWLATHAVNERSRKTMLSTYNAHIKKKFGGRTLAYMAGNRDEVKYMLAVDMADLSIAVRRRARQIIVSVVQEKIPDHGLGGIRLYDAGPGQRTDMVFPTFGQVAQVAKACGVAVPLMRGLGLRAGEALALRKEDFTVDGLWVKVQRQATRDGGTAALKKRKRGEFRMVPVPAHVRDQVRDMPDGPLCDITYPVLLARFKRAAKAAGIDAGFTPHSLRHAFASAMLRRGVPVSEVSKWLGHRDSSVTEKVYHHLLPEAATVARVALDAEFGEWVLADA